MPAVNQEQEQKTFASQRVTLKETLVSTIDLNHVVSMNNVSVMNSNFDIIEAAINGDVIHKTGGQNVMGQDLDLNGHALLNVTTNQNAPNSVLTTAGGDLRYYRQHQVSNPTLPGDAVPKSYVDALNLPQGAFIQNGTGAVSRTWQNKVGESVSVLDFIPVTQHAAIIAGISTFDCTSGFVAAIASLPTGAVLKVPKGLYNISGTINCPNKISIQGDGEYVTSVKAFSGSGYPIFQLDGIGSSLSGMTVDGGSLAQDCVQTRNTRQVLSSLYLINATRYGLFLTNNGANDSHNNQFVNIRCLMNGSDGLHVGVSGFDSEFVNVWVGQSGQHALYIEASDCFFSNIHLWGSIGNGAHVRAANARFVNLYAETNTGHGVDAFGSFNLSIVGGSLWKNGVNGANISTMTDFHISSISAYDNAGYGLSVSNSLRFGLSNIDFFNRDSAVLQDRPLVISGTSDFYDVVGCRTNPSQHSVGGAQYVGSNVSILDRDFGNTSPLSNTIYAAAGNNREFRFSTASSIGSLSPRWIWRCENTAEAGSNAGSNLQLLARTDTGTALSIPIQVNRASGQITLGDGSLAATNVRINSTSVTSATAGAASALPATPTGYLVINVNGTDRRLPYYT